MSNRKGNQYRQPSALGVPNAGFDGYRKSYETYQGDKSTKYSHNDNLKPDGLDFGDGTGKDDYKQYEGGRTQAYRPGSNLGQEGSHDFTTDKNNSYKAYDVSKPERVRGGAPDNLRSEGNLEKDTDYNKEYGRKYVDRSQAVRPGSNLGQYGDQDFRTDKNETYRAHDVNRPERRKGAGDNLRSEGNLEKDTDYNKEYGRKYVDRSQAVRPGSNLGQSGDQDFRTDKNEAYRAHDVNRPERRRGAGDNLRSEGDLEKDTDYNKEYGRKYADRSQAVRPGSNLGQSGDQDFRTDKNEAYRAHDVNRPERRRGAGDNLRSEGDLEKDTDYNKEYGRKYADRSQAVRPGSNLGQYGDQDFRTDKNEAYRAHDVNRPERRRGAGDNLRSEGDLEKDTDYNKEYGYKSGDRSQAVRPGSNLGQYGDQDFRTDKNEAYRAHDVNRPERRRGAGDNLRSEGDLEKDTDYNREYGYKDGERGRAVRPGSNLGQDGDHDWRTDKNEAYRQHDASRPERARGKDDQLRPEGDMGGLTDYQKEYIGKNGERSRAVRPGSNLGQDGDHDWRTDKNEAYRRHDASRPDRARGKDDQLRPEGDMGGLTDYQKEYIGKNGERSRAVRPGSNLGQDGDHDWRTDKNEAYRQHDASRPDRARGKDDQLRPEGEMGGLTDYQKEYIGKNGERSRPVRPGSNLGQDGDHDWRTDKNEAYRRHDASRPEKARGKDDQLRPEGEMGGMTDYQKEYIGRNGERVRGVRPSSNLAQEGERDWNTDKGYRQHDVRRTEKIKGEDNLRPNEGYLDDETENRKEYGEKYGEKTHRYRPGSNLAQEGDQDWNTDKGYNRHDVQRTERIKGEDNLRPNDGHLDDETEHRKQYGQKYGEKAQKYKHDSNLRQEGDQDWNTDKGYREHDVQKREKYRGEDNLRPNDGRLDDNTEYGKQYQERKLVKNQAIRRNSTLAQEGDMDLRTHKKSAFKGPRGSKQGAMKRDDNLGPGDGRLDGTTEHHDRYKQHDSKRPGQIKQGDNIGLNGGRLDDDTEYKKYQSHDGQGRKKPIKGQDNISVNKGRLYTATENKSQYGTKAGQKPNKAKHKDNLAPNTGKMAWETMQNTEYNEKEVKKVHQVRAQDNMTTHKGTLDGTTETQEKYGPKDTQPLDKKKPRKNLLPNHGGIEGSSETKDQFQPQYGRRSGGRRPEENLKPQIGKIEGRTEAKSQYGTKQGRRAEKSQPPKGNLSTNSDAKFADGTISKYSYDYREASFSGGKPQKVRIGTSMKGMGGIEGRSEYDERYSEPKGEKAEYVPVNDLLTPYGEHHASSARRLGDVVKVGF